MKGIIILSFIFSLQVKAQLSDYCALLAKDYGSPEKAFSPIIEDCANEVFKNARVNAKRESITEQVKLSGHSGIIVLQENNKKLQYYAGPSAKVEDVIALSFLEQDKIFGTLDGKSGEIKFYWSSLPGNVTPFRTLSHPSLTGAVDIALSRKTKQSFVLNPKNNSIVVIGSKYNSRGKKEEKQVKVKKIVNSQLKEATSLIVNPDDDFIAVNLSRVNKVLVFNIKTGSLIKTIETSEELNQLRPSLKKNTFYGIKADGSKMSFSI